MGFRGKHANKRDANEGDLVTELKALGYSVYRMDQPVDLLIGKNGRTWIAEVKMEGANLNENQQDFYWNWRGNVTILRSVEDVREFHERNMT